MKLPKPGPACDAAAAQLCDIVTKVLPKESRIDLGDTFTDGSRNNVARCKIFLRVDALHHALTRCIEKNAAFSTHCFTDQCLLARCFTSTPQNCWVKLNELEIACL